MLAGVAVGNTPTHVGKTDQGVHSSVLVKKHPHACGEDHCSLGPLLRDHGNTPTHVGKTLSHAAVATGTRKHPHACGEDSMLSNTARCSTETPPRMWGRRNTRRNSAEICRNTPTHVGKTKTDASDSDPSEKHPHACGEDGDDAQVLQVIPETPPRMWGRPHGRFYGLGRGGNTPTHVGKTRINPPQRHTHKKHPHACGEDASASKCTASSPETPPRMWGRHAGRCVLLHEAGNTPTHVGKTRIS